MREGLKSTIKVSPNRHRERFLRMVVNILAFTAEKKENKGEPQSFFPQKKSI